MIKDPSSNLSLHPKNGRTVKISEASRILQVHKDTLRRWEKSGKITPVRTPGGTRLYSLDELSKLNPHALANLSQPSSTKQSPTKNLSRTNEEGTYSHIYNKGIEKRIIFNDDEDYEVFQDFLKDYLTAPKDPDSIKKSFQVHGRMYRGTPHQPKNYFHKVELIAYSLMPDHFHLILNQKTRGSLESFIRSLCTRYSIYFNKKYTHTGAVFEGPYKSVQIKDEPQLLKLTRFLHHAGVYSSYADYLGIKVTSWVKPAVVLSFYQAKPESFAYERSSKPSAYKDYVDNYQPDQEEKELIENITFDSIAQHLERIDIARNLKNHPKGIPDEFFEKKNSNQPLNLLQRIPEILASVVIFSLLLAIGITNITLSKTKDSTPSILGIKNIVLSTIKNPEPSLTASPTFQPSVKASIPPVPSPTVSPKTAEVKEIKSKVMLTIKIDDASSSVNIRQKPTTNSEKIGQARDGDTFEFLSLDSGWYEIKLVDGSTGFISAKYVEEGEVNN